MLLHVIRPIPQTAKDFIKRQEGLRLRAYIDSVGVCTIGYGHTGPDVHPDRVIDQATADTLLDQDCAKAARELEDRIGEDCVSELTENQYSALLSFVFNLGVGPPQGNPREWHIWRYLRAQQFDAAYAQLPLFCNAGGHKDADLVRRRAQEQVLWSTNEPGTLDRGMSSAVTRQIDTPPIPPQVDPLSKSKHFIAGCVTACVSGASAMAPVVKKGIDQTSDAIAPYVGHSSILRGVADHLALAAAGLAAVTVLLTWLSHERAKSQ